MNSTHLPKILVAAALAAIVVAAGLLAGCGGDDETTTPTVQTTPPASTASTPSATTGTEATPAPTPPTTAPGGGGKVAIPNLVGGRLDAAQASLVKLGLSGRAENRTGSRTEIERDWEVCEMHPAAGKRVAPGSPVTLVTARPGGC
ncbi:MAG: PASTA domain-containing protein [Solirubrobacterales bacterium]